jgi:L-amino acid N-acyltransferase YncA
LVLSEPRSDVLKNVVVVREASIGDEKQILTIRNDPKNYRWFFNDFPITAEEHSKWFKKRLHHANFFTLVAEVDNCVIGIAYLSEFDGATPKISISIKSDFQANGIGSKLLKELVLRSTSVGLDSVFADIRCSNVSSIRFFSRNNFITVSQDSKRTGEIHTEVLTLVLKLIH